MALNCPGCSATVADGTAICPECDYIIDTSFLSSDPPEADDEPAAPPPAERTAVGPAPKAPPGRARTPPRRSGSRAAVPRAAPARPARRPEPEPEPEPEEEDDDPPAPKVAPEPDNRWRNYDQDRPAPAAEKLSQSFKPEEELGDIKAFIGNLPTSDKLTLIGAAGTVLAAFFPWKDTAQEGEIIGLMTLGVFVLLAALVALAALVVRTRGLMPRLSPVFPWLVQLGANCFAILWCLVFIKLAWNNAKMPAYVGAGMQAASTPAMGAFLGLSFSILSLGGTLMGLKDKPL